jgi:hypothetical protein
MSAVIHVFFRSVGSFRHNSVFHLQARQMKDWTPIVIKEKATALAVAC